MGPPMGGENCWGALVMGGPGGARRSGLLRKVPPASTDCAPFFCLLACLKVLPCVFALTVDVAEAFGGVNR